MMWMTQCKCAHRKLCRLPWGSIPTTIHYNRNTIDTKAILNQEHKIWRNNGKCIIGKILDQSNVLINKMTDTLISHECLSVFLPIMSKGRIIQWKISSVKSFYNRLACTYQIRDLRAPYQAVWGGRTEVCFFEKIVEVVIMKALWLNYNIRNFLIEKSSCLHFLVLSGNAYTRNKWIIWRKA